VTLFSAIYGYEDSGEPSWFVGMSSLLQSAGGWVASSMPLQICANGPALGLRPQGAPSCGPLSGSSTTIQFGGDGRSATVVLPSGTQVPLQRYRV